MRCEECGFQGFARGPKGKKLFFGEGEPPKPAATKEKKPKGEKPLADEKKDFFDY